MLSKEHVLTQLKDDIQLRGFSRHTEYEYLTQARLFLEYTYCPVEELAEEHFINYLKYLHYEKKLKPETINIYNSCIKFLYDVTLKKYLSLRQIPRIRKSHKLPSILDRD